MLPMAVVLVLVPAVAVVAVVDVPSVVPLVKGPVVRAIGCGRSSNGGD
jgi:hypothetical protein